MCACVSVAAAAAAAAAGIRFTHGAARLQQWGNRQTNHHYVHAHCVNGGLGHDHELFPKQATDQDAVDAVTRQRDTITRTAADTEILLPFAQDPDQASTAAPPDDERELFGREEALRMDEEIMHGLPVVRTRHVGQHQRLAWHDVRSTAHKVQACFTTSPTCQSTSHHSQQCLLGEPLFSVAGSFWDDLQSMRPRATAHTFWMRDWSCFGLRTGQHSGPRYVPNVMLLRCRTRRAERTSSKKKKQSLERKVATSARTGKKRTSPSSCQKRSQSEQNVQAITSLYPTVPVRSG